ncbi:MAG: prepilin peptidase, partial [Woeseiaceae bacterium]
MLELFSQSPPLFVAAVFVASLLVGSFLNVVIHRLPIMMEREWRAQCAEVAEQPARDLPEGPFDLVTPRSRCPNCGAMITAAQNIPILSYLLLRGRCAHCKARIPLRYPVVEGFTALATAFVAWHFGFGWEAAAAIGMTWALIAISVIDIDHQLIPDSISLPLLWAGLVLSLFHPLPGAGRLFIEPESSIVGALAGYLTLWSIYHLFRLLTGKEGMGYGDFKLLAALGAWLGWQMLPLIILLSALVGAVVGVSLIVLKRHDRQVPIPFGPYLAAAGWIAMLYG